MNNLIKTITVVTLVVVMLTTFFSVSFTANAANDSKVRVIIKNDVFDVEDGAAWDGTLLDEWIDINEESTMLSAVIDALDNHNYTQEGAESGYITNINGLDASDSSFFGGWMGTLNDWFTNEGLSAYNVADGTLEAGDEICIMYTDLMGADIGCLWGVPYTYLDNLEIEGGILDETFDSDITDYILTLDEGVSSVKITPTAYNKNYQVRIYKNEYHPENPADYKRNDSIEVSDSDIIFIGVGNKNWPSMDIADEETVYCIYVDGGQEENFEGATVIVRNDTFSTEDGAAWDDVLLYEYVELNEDSSVQSVVEDALKSNDISYEMNGWGYLATIDGLSEYDCNGSGGWMITLNDWFTTESASSYTVSNGGLTNDDVITVVYTCNFGADVGSIWGNSDTRLASLDIGFAELDKEFNPDVTEYNLIIHNNEGDYVDIVPQAINKNYQVRTYINEYTPEQDGTEYKVLSNFVEVVPGDTIYIGVGNEHWPTMNDKAEETVYKLMVVYEPEIGDVNLDGIVDINDATLLQKYIANLEDLSEEQLRASDANQDGEITIADATVIQKMIAGLIYDFED